MPIIEDFVVVGYYAYCHNCKLEVEPIHVCKIRGKVVDAAEVAKKLPPRFQKYILRSPGYKSEAVNVSIDDVIEALFGK